MDDRCLDRDAISVLAIGAIFRKYAHVQCTYYFIATGVGYSWRISKVSFVMYCSCF